EPVPPEPQDHAADGADREVVGRHGAAAVALERAADAGPEGNRATDGDEPAHGVHHGRPGKVTEDRMPGPPVEPAHGVAEPPARAPGPVPEDRVDEPGYGGAVDDVAFEPGAPDHGARRHR